MADTFSVPSKEVQIPLSILDTDLYKLTMQNAVLHHFHDAQVVIKFTNRSPHMLFNRESFKWIQERVNRLSELTLTSSERTALANACPYFPDTYLDFLVSMRLHPETQIRLDLIPKDGDEEWGEISCRIEGFWRDCILYEVPIMSILSEAYFKFVDTDWNLDDKDVKGKAKQKALSLLNPPSPITPLSFSEFGTRRRRSFHVQDLVIQGLIEGYEEWKSKGGKTGALAGTSNVYFALKYGLRPTGTIAHEWIMAIGATYGYKGCNGKAMDLWEEVYPRTANAPPLTMLTDTFTAQTFFQDYRSDPKRAMRWTTLRQDSGDPFTFAKQAKEAVEDVYEQLGKKEEAQTRVIFSDGLHLDNAVELQKGFDELGVSASFGIGTFLTNDFTKASDPSQISKPLNIVIKLNQINGKNCVKLSDDKGKVCLGIHSLVACMLNTRATQYTGDFYEVKRVQEELGLVVDHVDKRVG